MIGSNKQIWTPLVLAPKFMYEANYQGSFSNGMANYSGYGSTANTLNVSNWTNTTDSYIRTAQVNGTTNLATIQSVSEQQSLISGDFSIFFRVKFTDPNSGSRETLFGSTVTGNSNIQFVTEGAGELRFLGSDITTNTFLASTNTSILSSGTWYNITLTRTSDTISIYLDSVSQSITYSNQSYISTYLSTLGFNSKPSGLMNCNFGAIPTRTAGEIESTIWFDYLLNQHEINLLQNHYSYA